MSTVPGVTHHRSVRLLVCAVILLAQVSVVAAANAPGVLRIGTAGDYAPFSFHDASGALNGFDIAVAQRLANDLGRPLALVPFRWPDLVAQIESGAFDVAMSGVTVRADRAVRIAYTRPYAVTGAVAVIRARERRRYRRLADLDRAGVRLGVNAGGHLEEVARQRFPHAHLVPVSDNRTLPNLLQHGEVDAVVSEEFEAHTWPAKPFVIRGPFTHDRKAYAVAPSATELLPQINDWLAARETDGWLNEQRRRWLGKGAMVTPAQAGFEALVSAIDLRLQLMPLVAAVKRRDHLPIDDPAQEARVLERVRSSAASAGLNADDVAELFRVQIEAAKAAERSTAPASVSSELTLAQLRTAIGRATDQIISELGRCQPWLGQPAGRRQLEAVLRTGLTAASASTRATLRDAIERVRRGS